MEVLSVAGKDYVKASVIARDLGYTADYVGQLCRSRKVNAKLVGRSWYVDRNSIHLHKSNRYRSTQAKTRESLQEEIEIVHAPDRGVRVPVHVTQTSLQTRKPAYVSYSEDQADLIPAVSKTPKQTLPVELADAATVSITSASKSYVFQTPKLAEIKFKGAIPVMNFEEENVSEDTKKKHIHPKIFFGKDKNKAKNIDSSSVHINVINTPAGTSENIDSVHFHHDRVEVAHVSIESNEDTTSKPSSLMLFAVTVFSLGIVLVMLGLESNVWVVDQTFTSSYSFAIENLTASVHTAVDDLKSFLYLVEFSTNFFIF